MSDEFRQKRVSVSKIALDKTPRFDEINIDPPATSDMRWRIRLIRYTKANPTGVCIGYVESSRKNVGNVVQVLVSQTTVKGCLNS